MCGRYTVSHSAEEILQRFQAAAEGLTLEPNYNVAPSQVVPIVISNLADAEGAPRLLQLCKWGFMPFWASQSDKSKAVINARAESIATKPAFKQAFKKRRCIVPAESFYEWKRDSKTKIPVRIRLSGERLMGFAGIYQDWKSGDGTKIRTCAIITVPANEIMERIHDRMPAILTEETEKVWLDPTIEDEEALSRCLAPYPSEEMEAYIVSTIVNSPRVNGPQCIEEAAAPDPDAQPPARAKGRTKARKNANPVENEAGTQLTLPFAVDEAVT